MIVSCTFDPAESESESARKPFKRRHLHVTYISFVFNSDAAFRERLVELRAFVAEHGHMKTPSSVNGNRSRLYKWMNYQRLRRRAAPNRYRHCRPIRQAEIDALDALGFDWDVGQTPSEPEVANLADNKNDLPVTGPSASKRQRHSPLRMAATNPVVETTDEEQL